MRPELVIAEKEFMDHLTSKRFLVILAVLLLLAAYAMATGMDQYNKSLDQYKKDKATGADRYQEAVRYQQQMIDNATQNGVPAAQIESMKAELQNLKNNMDYFLNPSMPSLLQVFQVFTVLFGFLGMVLGIAMGFDQLTKEKESGSLKSVLSAPIYRDSLINGKTIGSMASLAVAVGITFLVIIAIMLFYGVVPGLEDLIRIGLFFIASMLYCTTFFAIAMLTSTVSRNSAMAVILAIAIVVSYLVVAMASVMISTFAAESIAGPAPVYQPPAGDNDTNASAPYYPYYDPANHYYKDWADKRIGLQSQISDVLNIVSPLYDFTGLGSMYPGVYPGVGQALLSREKPVDNPMDYYAVSNTASDPYSRPAQVSILDSLSYSWMKALALVLETLVALALSYVIFMRMDVR
jgi:ABC-2 type transport system permease protein